MTYISIKFVSYPFCMKIIFSPALLIFCISLFAQAPSGYYQSATSSGYTLKTQLHDIIDGHTDRGYEWTFYETYDIDTYFENDGSIIDIYSENPNGPDPYNFTSSNQRCGNQSSEGDCYNREHSFPSSWFNKSFPMFSDVHHLYPTDGRVNNFRSNHPFGEVGSATFTSQNGSKLGSARSGLGYSGTVFEPIDEFKGDLARAYFYMATRYEDVLSNWSSDMLDGSADQVYEDWALAMLMDWHSSDPVSQKEIDRNNNAQSFQGNRNPFIDHPEWVNAIWGEGTPIISLSDQSSINFGNVASGLSSVAQSYSVSASNLTAAVSITVPAPFELSIDQSTWSTSITISQSNAENGINNTVYVRFSPTVENGNTFNAQITHSSASAPTINRSVSGTEQSAISNPNNLTLIAFQSFENSANDNWLFTQNPTEGTLTSSSDIWTVRDNLSGLNTMPSDGSNFFAGQDLRNDDNPNETFGTLDLSSVDISGRSNVKIKFDFDVLGFEPGDFVEYQITVDEIPQSPEVFAGGSVSSTISGTETISIPNGSASVSIKIKVTQDGGADVCGFDNFQLIADPIVYTWTGTTNENWTVASNWQNGAIPPAEADILIDNPIHQPSITTDAVVNNLEIVSGNLLTVASGASLAIMGTYSGTGQVMVKRNTVGDNGYSIIGTPIANANIVDFPSSFIYDYDGSNFIVPVGQMNPGKGYFIAFEEANPTITFTGVPNATDINVSISENGDKFNVVSNPYMAAIDRGAFIFENANAIDGNIWLWDDGGTNEGANRGGDYIVINEMGATSTQNLPGNGQKGEDAFNGKIGSMQGFLVKANANETLVFKQSMQSTQENFNSDLNFYRKTNIDPEMMRLSLSGNGLYNEIIIGFDESATLGQDFGMDAEKFSGNELITFYSKQNDHHYAIQALPLLASEEVSIELGMSLAEAGNYQIKLKENSLNNDRIILLLDKQANQIIDLEMVSDYSFFTKNVNKSERFELMVAPKTITSLTPAQANDFIITTKSNGIQISADLVGSKSFSVFTIDGRTIHNGEIMFQDGQAIADVKLIPNQLYVIRLSGISKKLVIK